MKKKEPRDSFICTFVRFSILYCTSETFQPRSILSPCCTGKNTFNVPSVSFFIKKLLRLLLLFFVFSLPLDPSLLRWKIVAHPDSWHCFLGCLFTYLLACLHTWIVHVLCVTWYCCCQHTFSLVAKQFAAKQVKVGRISSRHAFNCIWHTPTFSYPYPLTYDVHAHTNPDLCHKTYIPSHGWHFFFKKKNQSYVYLK